MYLHIKLLKKLKTSQEFEIMVKISIFNNSKTQILYDCIILEDPGYL